MVQRQALEAIVLAVVGNGSPVSISVGIASCLFIVSLLFVKRLANFFLDLNYLKWSYYFYDSFLVDLVIGISQFTLLCGEEKNGYRKDGSFIWNSSYCQNIVYFYLFSSHIMGIFFIKDFTPLIFIKWENASSLNIDIKKIFLILIFSVAYPFKY